MLRKMNPHDHGMPESILLDARCFLAGICNEAHIIDRGLGAYVRVNRGKPDEENLRSSKRTSRAWPSGLFHFTDNVDISQGIEAQWKR